MGHLHNVLQINTCTGIHSSTWLANLQWFEKVLRSYKKKSDQPQNSCIILSSQKILTVLQEDCRNVLLQYIKFKEIKILV